VHAGLNEKYITTFCPPLPRYSRICNYHPHGITVLHLPFPRNYRKTFPIPAVITAVLPFSPLLCQPLVGMTQNDNSLIKPKRQRQHNYSSHIESLAKLLITFQIRTK